MIIGKIGFDEMKTIDVGKDFISRLATRNEAIIFCEKYLKELEDPSNWQTDEPFITLDFVNVRKISPGFASEAFACFIDVGATPEKILKKIIFKNISNVQMEIINTKLHWDESIDLSDIPELGDEFWENAKVYRKGDVFPLKNSKRSNE